MQTPPTPIAFSKARKLWCCCLFHHRAGSCCAWGEQRIVRPGTVPVLVIGTSPAFGPIKPHDKCITTLCRAALATFKD